MTGKTPYTEDGYDLFPERQDVSFKHSWRSKLFSGHGEAGTEKLKCERNVFKNIKRGSLVRLMMKALKSSGCPVDFRRHIVCEFCDSNVTGGYDPKLNQIVVCENKCKSESMVHGVLTHEMIHMFDYCVNKLDFRNLEHLACTEIRAANLTHCSFASAMFHGNASLVNIRQQHETCVKHTAVYSVLAVRDTTMEEAVDIVNKVFPKCYKDLEPIGRRIRRNSLDMFQALEEANYFYP